jgi:hypothetical protein
MALYVRPKSGESVFVEGVGGPKGGVRRCFGGVLHTAGACIKKKLTREAVVFIEESPRAHRRKAREPHGANTLSCAERAQRGVKSDRAVKGVLQRQHAQDGDIVVAVCAFAGRNIRQKKGKGLCLVGDQVSYRYVGLGCVCCALTGTHPPFRHRSKSRPRRWTFE